MLIRNILEESARKFDEVKAVKWLNKKEIMERSYGELMENVGFTRKGLLAEGFEGKHIALIGTSSVEWMESYLGIITGCTTAVPLDAALPCEDLIDLLNRSFSSLSSSGCLNGCIQCKKICLPGNGIDTCNHFIHVIKHFYQILHVLLHLIGLGNGFS